MEKNEILQEIIDYYCKGNKRQFANKIGISPQGVSTWLKRNTFDADIIIAKCEHISPAYLLTGEGSITLKEDGTSVYSPKSEQKSTDKLNELLAVAHSLQEMSQKNADLLAKTQEQFDRVLNMFERVLAMQENNNLK